MMESLAKTRERRNNAGNRMGQMLEKDEEDFYKSTYGGFYEEEDDREYVSEASESDNVDSDFDIDENDDVIEMEEDDDEKRKRRSAYKPPPRHEDKKPVKSIPKEKLAKPSTSARRPVSSSSSSVISSKKSLRTSTQMKSEATEKRKKAAEKKKRIVPRIHYRELTQEELLEEAKETEVLNVKSLERYEKLELEKSRKHKNNKERNLGPVIRLQSLTMPLVTDLNDDQSNSTEKCSRNFITFTDDALFDQYFPNHENNEKLKNLKKGAICPITKLPARYFDPVTNMPYANAFAFGTLREAYCKQLELIVPSQQSPEVKALIAWRKGHQTNVTDEDIAKSNSNGGSEEDNDIVTESLPEEQPTVNICVTETKKWQRKCI